MAVRSRDEILEMVRNRIGEDNSDEALAMLEDMTDTLSDYEARISDAGDWKTKYEENDAAWRTRYRERFENAPAVNEPTDTVGFVAGETTVVIEDEPDEPETYDDLFKEE